MLRVGARRANRRPKRKRLTVVDGGVVCTVGGSVRRAGHRCVQCLESLPNGKFFDKDMRLYCEVDYMLLFGDRCARCGEAILGRCLNALDLKWHPEHFTCDECGDSLAGSSFFKRLGRPFCKPCNEKLKQTGTRFAARRARTRPLRPAATR